MYDNFRGNAIMLLILKLGRREITAQFDVG